MTSEQHVGCLRRWCWRRYLYLRERKQQDGGNYIIRTFVIFVLNTLLWWWTWGIWDVWSIHKAWKVWEVHIKFQYKRLKWRGH
jgi:hypothetical protein